MFPTHDDEPCPPSSSTASSEPGSLKTTPGSEQAAYEKTSTSVIPEIIETKVRAMEILSAMYRVNRVVGTMIRAYVISMQGQSGPT